MSAHEEREAIAFMADTLALHWASEGRLGEARDAKEVAARVRALPVADDAGHLLNLRYALEAHDTWGAAGELADCARALLAKRDGQGVG